MSSAKATTPHPEALTADAGQEHNTADKKSKPRHGQFFYSRDNTIGKSFFDKNCDLR